MHDAGPSTKAEEFASALRELATFYESHSDLPVPSSSDLYVFVEGEANDAKAALRVFARAGFRKAADDTYFSVERAFGRVRLRVFARRELVCRSRKVGTRVVPAMPERTVPVYEWECDPLLKDSP